MTVLAHELGHLHYRHSMRALVRSTLLSAFAAWYFGDFSSFAAGATAALTGLEHSRAAEHEADLYALSLMRANRISTHGAAVLFCKIERWQSPKDHEEARPESTASLFPNI